MPISKPDFNLIFASQAPSQDLPAAFNNYARGWDEARKNNGKPTIKQFNYLIQQLDLKALWMIQNGAALPFDETVDYAEGAFTVKDGLLQQFIGGVWKKPTQTADQIFDESGKTQQEVNNSFVQSFLFDNFGVVSSSQLKDYMATQAIQAQIKTDGTDQTEILRAYLFAAKSLKLPIQLPAGIIVFSDTLTIDYAYLLSGAGRDVTILRFKNSIANKPALSFVRGATKGVFANFTLQDETFGTSIGIKFSDSRTDVGSPLWKDFFYNMEILGFNISHTYTSANPLNGATHAHCSEMFFLNCRFLNNKTTALLQNCQAVNNTYYRCDFENFDTSYINGQTITDTNFDFFREEAGAGVLVEASSFIGRGRWYSWRYPTGGSTLYAGSAYFKMHDTKAELRTPHCGVLIEELIHGVNGTLGLDVNVTSTHTVNFGASVDLIRFGGRVNAIFDDIAVALGTGKLVIRNYPTLGRSSGPTTGAQSTVHINNSGNVYYERETSSPYGTYNRNATPAVVFKGQRSGSTNTSYLIDSNGWMTLNCGGDIQQLSQTFGTMSQYGKLVYNMDNVVAGIAANAQLKIVMPKHGRPLKLFTFKHAQRLSYDLQFNLYLVKDKANWTTPENFSLTSDAIKVAETGSTLNKAGYFEAPVNLTSAVLGTETQSGFGSWLEGRMLIEYVGTVAYAGFVGIDYI